MSERETPQVQTAPLAKLSQAAQAQDTAGSQHNWVQSLHSFNKLSQPSLAFRFYSRGHKYFPQQSKKINPNH